MNGGMQRCFHILHQLAIHFNVTAIIHQDKESFLQSVKDYPAIKGIKIYSTKDGFAKKDIFSLLPSKMENALRYRWIKKTFKGPADSMFLAYYPVLRNILSHNKFDVIILENLRTLNAVKVICKFDQSVRIIYDAHNVDTNLASNSMTKFGMTTKDFSLIEEAESNLYKTVNEILVCSEKDRADLVKMNKNKLVASVIPNGVSVTSLFDAGVRQDKPEYILFCGALWTEPNGEGLFWFYEKIWPTVKEAFPDLKLLVVGSGELDNKYLSIKKNTSMEFTGSVDDVTQWYNKATLSIVPLLSGSGTRLKILEAMSFGLPVISTSKGAEGIEYKNGKDIIIADKENEFAEEIIRLLKNKEKRISIQDAARVLVTQKYDWNIIGNAMADIIRK